MSTPQKSWQYLREEIIVNANIFSVSYLTERLDNLIAHVEAEAERRIKEKAIDIFVVHGDVMVNTNNPQDNEIFMDLETFKINLTQEST